MRALIEGTFQIIWITSPMLGKNLIAPVAPAHNVGAAARVEVIDTCRAEESVVAGFAVDEVVARAAVDPVGGRRFARY